MLLSNLRKRIFLKHRQAITAKHELNYLFWECTTRCNLSCLHCGSDCSKDSVSPDMPVVDFLNALDTIKNPADNFIVVLTGGEALLRTDIEYCGFEIRKRGMRWSLVSNGHLYTPERHISLLNAGMGALTISLDGLQNNHNWLRNNKSSFDKVSQAIGLAARSARLNFDVVTCVNKRNIDELLGIMDHIVALGVKSWRLFTIVPIGRAESNEDLFLSDAEFNVLMEFIATHRKSARIDIKFSCEGYVGKYELSVRDEEFFCRAGINIASVLIDGSISACPNINRDFSQGNIYADNFADVWENKFQLFRDRRWAKQGRCAGCTDFELCQGNGLHYWQGADVSLQVCHNSKLQ